MKILFVVPYTPNLIRMRSYNLIRSLAQRGHQVTVATLWSDEQEREETAALSREIHSIEASHLPRWRSYLNCIAALPSRTPLQAVYCWEPGLAKRLDRLVAMRGMESQFDVVHVEHLRGARYGLWIKTHHPELPIVWDSVDCISLLFKLASEHGKQLGSRWITSFELGRNQLYEGWLVRQFDHTVITSPIDKQALLDLVDPNLPQPEISILPVGVNLEYFKPDVNGLREHNRLVISGKMSYHANVSMVLHFVENIFPRIQAARPDVKLWIAGKDPTREIKALDKNPSIDVTGTVKDLRPFIQHATVSLSPITYGAGIQIKVLEAMACGTPVVSTTQAVSALQVVHGRDVLVADTPDEFAAHVLRLLPNQEYQKKIGEAGLQYVENFHKWSSIVSRLEGIYDEAIHHKN